MKHLTSGTGLIAMAICLAIFPQAHAETHAPHVHGEAEIAVIVEGDKVSVSLMSAMYNITGFEHEPETDAQRDILNSAIAILDGGGQLFEINASAGCTSTLSRHSLKSEEDEASQHEHEDHEAEDEDHHHHRDLEADYEFTCEHPSRLRTMKMRLFEPFGNLQKVNAIVFLEDRQTAMEMTPSETSLPLASS